MPQHEEEWLSVANEFNIRWNFPHCVGVMDGKHIMMQAPKNSGSDFFNYKGFFSVVLFGIANADYQLQYFNIGSQGRISDGGVFNSTTFKKMMIQSKLNLPEEAPLPGRSKAVPFVFLGDDAFPLCNNILKPFPGQQEKGSEKRIFNYRLSRARRVSENVFGILAARFRVLRKPLLLEPEKVEIVISSCIYLHNYLRGCSKSRSAYTPTGTFDSEDKDTGEIIPGSWRDEVNRESIFTCLNKTGRKSSIEVQNIRNEYASYFTTPLGSVPWQQYY